MQWIEWTVETSSAGIDLVAARLTALGFDSFIMDDQEDFHDFLRQNQQYWDYVDEELEQRMAGVSRIRLYTGDTAEAREAAGQLYAQLGLLRDQFPQVDFGPLTVAAAPCRDEDWENNWKQYYQPLPIGRRLLVVPQWLSPENPEGRVMVRLDPGMIFGTGAHASTQMCMEALEDTICGGERVVDLGSGSGILSFTALLLGADTAVGVDIDPKAEDIARENAAVNGLDAARFQAVTGNVLADRGDMERLARGGYDVVLANIVADVIIPLAPVFPRFLRPGGTVICSGILDVREPEVRLALDAAGLSVSGRAQRDDWVCLTLRCGEEGGLA
ncbi:MAG: 50S ribosomal protein L11 methyltransferase [Oscillospiraceae bacterium]|nr:50S ribosomal protein L11 methyltransferase [Oscillospiraceae bacterium]